MEPKFTTEGISDADRETKKYSKIKIAAGRICDSENAVCNYMSVDQLISTNGHHIQSLTINFRNEKSALTDLRKIATFCKSLGSLKIENWSKIAVDSGSESVPDFDYLANMETLTLYHSDISSKMTFFKAFQNLKYLNVSSCHGIDLKTLFQNNPNVESFVFLGLYFRDFELLRLLSTLESLCIDIRPARNSLSLKPLLQLDRLTKLKMWCNGNNLNDFLNDLAAKGIVQEIDLDDIKFDDDFFKVMPLFDKLQLLVLSSNDFNIVELKFPLDWPGNLKDLILMKFTISLSVFISTIKQLWNLENFDLYDCKVTNDDHSSFKDVTKLSQQIFEVMDPVVNQQKLTVCLPRYYGYNEDESKVM